MTENNQNNKNQESKKIINNYDFYIEQHVKMIDDYINFSQSDAKYTIGVDVFELVKSFFEIINNDKSIINKIFTNIKKKISFLELCLINFRIVVIIIAISLLECEKFDETLKFLDKVKEYIKKYTFNKKFKYILNSLYIHTYILSKNVDNAYEYCLKTIKYLDNGFELYYYSTLNLIFYKQNKSKCFEITQQIIEILKNNKNFNLKTYYSIAEYNACLKRYTKELQFLKLAIYFLKESFKKNTDKEQQGYIMLILSDSYYELGKYYMAIGYGKISLKYSKNQKVIGESLDIIASSYYCLSKFKNALTIYQQLIQFKNTDIAKRHMQIADCQYQLGEIELMKENIKKAYLIGSKDTQVQKNINETYTEMERGVYDSINDI